MERGLQRLDIEAQCFAAAGLIYVELYAVSAGDAVLKARRLISPVPATFEEMMRALMDGDA